MVYAVKAGEFEGPLELLLDLIDKNKLSINEVSLATITDEYIAYVRALEKFKPEEVASFLVIASTLMLIKSRSLLPQLDITDEEETDIQELEKRLQMLQRFREFSKHIQTFAQRGLRMHAREAHMELPIIFYPPEKLSVEDMLEMIKSMIAALPKKEILPEKTIRTIISLEQRMDELRRKVETSLQQTFKNFVGDKAEKVDVIISFLAVLELVKQGLVLVEQQGAFGDITIQRYN